MSFKNIIIFYILDYKMSRKISADLYKEITGLDSKKMGLYYARKYRIRYNKPKNTSSRNASIMYLEKIRDKIKEEDSNYVTKNILKNKINPFIIKNKNRVRISKNDYTNLNVMTNYKVRGVRKERKLLFENFTWDNVYDSIQNINNKDGYKLVIKFKIVLMNDGKPLPYSEYRTINNGSFNREKGEEYYKAEIPIQLVEYFQISYIKKKGKNNKREGGFFGYYIKKDDYNEYLLEKLERYQIYSDETINKLGNEENCLIHSLKLCGVDESILNDLRLKCNSGTIPLKYLENVAENNNLNIIVSCDDKRKFHNFNKKGEKEIKLCLVKNHFFINEEVDISNISINNYDKVKHKDEWWKLGKIVKNTKGKDAFYNKKFSNNSFRLVLNLFENNFFHNIKLGDESLVFYDYKKLINNNIQLTPITEEQVRKVKPKDIKYVKIDKDLLNKFPDFKKYYENNENLFDKKIDIKIGFDFESTTEGYKHEAYLVSFCIYKNDINEKIGKMTTYTGSECGNEFLKHVYNKINDLLINEYKIENKKTTKDKKLRWSLINKLFKFTLYAHNITYDIQFLNKYMSWYNPIYRAGNKVCGGQFGYYGMTFNLKDTWAIVDCKLEAFNSVFNLKKDLVKEVMPYAVYNKESVKSNCIKIDDALKYLSEGDKVIFLKNIEDMGFKINDHFNHIGYARYYCERDVELMMTGYFVFKSWIIDQLGINIDDFLTISSISDEYFKKTGCYKGCYSISGMARYYIQNTAVGGRCMSSQNLMYFLNEKLNDFDGVSLYPSAMKRLSEIGGYLKGKPKVIKRKNLNMNFLNSVDGYFIRIKLLKIPTKRDFPLMSYIKKDGVRVFSNEFDETNNVVYVNKIMLEDLIEFHNVKSKHFEILDGYYFDEGRCSKIGEIISSVFNLRQEFKSKENPIENLYKLIMNSAYGKTIMKANDTEIKFINGKDKEDAKDKLHDYIYKNYNNILESEKLPDCNKYIVKTRKPIHDHFNLCHIGSEILAMSKRIMNEVMCLAEDIGVKIYYQDTDSMHIENDKIEYLNKKYIKKYGRELIGKKLGQFHNDFAEIKVGKGKDIKPLYATKTIILGKKAYIDVIKYENGEYRTHCRMKGVPDDVLKIKANNIFEGSKNKFTEYKLYKHLYNGGSVEFDLLSGRKPCYNVGYGMIQTRTKFTRVICFTEEDQVDDVDEEYNDDIIKEEVFDNIED